MEETNELNQTYEEPQVPQEAPAPEAPAWEPAPAPAPQAPVGSDFTGSALANFGMNFVIVLVSLITLGIAYPFMLCWKLRWEADHTTIDGRQLVFDGKGGQLLGKYLLWILLCIVTIFIYAIFFMPLNMIRWKTKHTHFAGETGESKFDGGIGGLFGTNWVANFVTLITIGFGACWAHCYKERWYARHTVVDGHVHMFDGKGLQYFGKCFVWTLLTIITIGIYGIWVAVKKIKWTTQHTHLAS